MSKNYLITLTASQEANGEKEEMTFTAPGEYYMENGVRIIKYKEFSEESRTKDDYSLNTIKVYSDDKVSVIRKAEHTTRLFIEKDRLHQCHYQTPMGQLIFGVICTKLHNNLSDDGGVLDVTYSLNLNSQKLSLNRFILKVKEN
jgi:uncharacterized beta-barrel protein YwiB (DUF1934 family)